MNNIFKHKHSFLKWLLRLIAIFFILLTITALAFLIFEKNYQNKIYPGIYLGKINLSGETRARAGHLINKEINKINQTGIIFFYQNHQTNIMPTVSSLEGDIAYNIISFDTQGAANQAIECGRQNSFLNNQKIKFKAMFSKHWINIKIDLNEKDIIQELQNNFSVFETEPKNAQLVYSKNSAETAEFEISPESVGKIIDYNQALNGLKANLSKLDNSRIKLLSKTAYPQIYKKDCLNINSKAEKILEPSPLILKYSPKSKKWKIEKDQLTDWLDLKINPLFDKEKNNDKIVIGLNYEHFSQYLKKEISPDINQEPINAKFEIKNGRVLEFQASKDGQELNIPASIAKFEVAFINGQNEIELAVSELKSVIQMSDINEFGIKELIGTGHSNFSGSPKNRRHNIAIGANTVNGTLISPDEEFSLVKTLGEINKKSGYLPELVIKNNRTIPEYGGGLCQIGTTMFRSALGTGLPITARRNHSYRVSYYEPAGTDATIYSPWPDLTFLNDTDHHILIQSRIEGDNLYFDFWGTGDGRSATTTYPIIYNIVRPGPTRIIETLNLPPGAKKCTEHAHNGADAYFDYIVAYPDAVIKEKRFKSHYAPWQEVCLIGVEKLSDKEKKASSTKENP